MNIKEKENLLSACVEGNLKQIENIGSSLSEGDSCFYFGGINWQPIHYIMKFVDIECLRIMLEHPQIDTRAQTSEDFTALAIGCSIPNIPIEMIEMLVEKDKDLVYMVNKKKVSPLQMAIEIKRLDIVTLLVEQAAANINHCDLNGDHVLLYGGQLQRPRNCKLFFE